MNDDWSVQVGQTALLAAANCGHIAIVQMLLERGANINANDQVSDVKASNT